MDGDANVAATARIRNAQDLLVFMEEFEPGSVERCRKHCSPELLELLDHASKTTWIPLETDAEFVDAVVATYGEDRAEELWFEYSTRFVQTPLMRALFDGAVRLFGLSVGSLLKIVPRIWGTSYREAGEVEFERTSKYTGTLVMRDLPDAMNDRRGYYILLRGMFRGLYRLTRTREDFDFRHVVRAAEFRATFRWPSRSKKAEAGAADSLSDGRVQAIEDEPSLR